MGRTSYCAPTPIWLGALILGILVLPHVTIAGHHVRIWLFP